MYTHWADRHWLGDERVRLIAVEVFPELSRSNRELKLQVKSLQGDG